MDCQLSATVWPRSLLWTPLKPNLISDRDVLISGRETYKVGTQSSVLPLWCPLKGVPLHWFSDSQPHLSHHALATCQGEPAQLYLHELTTICCAHVAFVRESSLGHHFSHVTLHSRDKVLHPVGPPEVRENWHTTTLWVCLVYYRTVNYYGKQITSTIIMYALCELSGHALHLHDFDYMNTHWCRPSHMFSHPESSM